MTFLDDLRDKAEALCREIGMDDSQCFNFSYSLAIEMSRLYGGQQPYIQILHKRQYIDNQHIKVFAAWDRIRPTVENDEAAFQAISNELKIYTPRHIRRIINGCHSNTMLRSVSNG